MRTCVKAIGALSLVLFALATSVFAENGQAGRAARGGPSAGSPPSALECSRSSLINDCNRLRNTGSIDLRATLGLTSETDRSIIFNPLAAFNTATSSPKDEAGLLRNTQASPPARLRLERTAQDLRLAAIEMISGDIQPLSSEQQAMKERLTAMTIQIVSTDDDDCSLYVPAGFPAAAYDPDTNLLKLCPSLANLSAGEIERLISHELGHVVSPCAMSSLTSQLEGRSASTATSASTTSRTTGVNLGTSAGPALGSTPDLFREINSCLVRRHQSAFDEALRSRAAESRLPEERSTIQCSSIFDEHFADAFSARLFGRRVETGHVTHEQARVAMIGTAAMACMEEVNGAMTGGRYLSAAERLRIAAQDPAILNALGCSSFDGNTAICSLNGFRPDPVNPTSGTTNGAAGSRPGQVIRPTTLPATRSE